MKINDQIITSFMGLKFRFNGIRILDNILHPVTWDLEIELVAVDYSTVKSSEEMQDSGNIAFQKIYFWLETCLPGTIMINIKNELGFNIANSVDNIMMYLPGEPSDDLVIRVLHSKIHTIAKEQLYIGALKLTASDTATTYTFTSDDGYNLPETVQEYTEHQSLHVDPWWTRHDSFSFEFLKDENENQDELIDMFKDIEDPLKTFEDVLINGIRGTDTEPRKSGEVIEFKHWKPTCV